MRRNYIVTYDIRDDKRLRKVFKTCKGYGVHLQYSVFECDLTDMEKAQFEAKLLEIISQADDQVLFVDLGPAAQRGERVVTSLGQSYLKFDDPCYVV